MDAATLRLEATCEPFLPLRAVPPGRDRAARLPGEPDASWAAARAREKLTTSAADHAGPDAAGDDRARSLFVPRKQQVDVTFARRQEGHRPLRDAARRRSASSASSSAASVKFDSKGTGGFSWVLARRVVPAVPAADRLLDLPDEPGAGRRLEGDELRQVAREADDARLAEDRLQGRGRRGRGGRGAARDQGVPREPEEVPGARRAHPQGRAALRAARHRQDAARARGRRRGGRAVLLDLRLRLRRDVRRRRRMPRPRPLRAGEAELAVHHLHGRDRRGRPPSRRRPRRRARRARADAEPAPRRDGRVRAEGQHHPDRGHEPARHPRPGAAAPGPLRPADRRRPARPQRPPQDPRGALEGQAARPDDRPRHARRRHARASRAPTSRTSSTRRRCSRRAAARRRSARRSSRKGSCA